MKEFSNEQDFDKQDIQELLQQFDNLLKGLPGSYIEEEAFEQLIDYFESKEAFKRALQVAEIAAQQFPFSSSLLVRKADLLLQNKKYELSLEVLEGASLLDTANIDIYILKTEALLALDRHEEAVQLLEEALAIFIGEEKIELLFELSDVYDDYGEFEKVFDCLVMILQQQPTNQEALYKICFWTDFTGRNAESIELHQKIIDDYPYNELAWFNLAAAYQSLKLYEKAIDAYKYAVTIDENFDYAYRNMGDAYIRLRKYKDAIEALSKVIEISKPEDVIYEAIGYCYERLKNHAQARFYYRRATHLSPENSHLFYKVALTYFREENWQACIKQVTTALRLKKSKPEYHLLLGECLMNTGQSDEAIQELLMVVKLRPKSVAGWEALIICLYKNEYYDQALEQLAIAAHFTADKPVFYYYKAAILFAMGKSKQALLELEEGLSQAPAMMKRLIALHPDILQNASIADLMVKYKRKRP